MRARKDNQAQKPSGLRFEYRGQGVNVISAKELGAAGFPEAMDMVEKIADAMSR